MLTPTRQRRARALVAIAAIVAGATWAVPVLAQDSPIDVGEDTTTTASDPVASTTPETTPGTTPVGTTPPDPTDPTQGEGLQAEPVPADVGVVPPRTDGTAVDPEAVGRLVRKELDVAKAEAVKVGTSYAVARQRTIQLESELDVLEDSVTELATTDRAAVRRVEAARRHFEARAAAATIRGRLDDFAPDVPDGDPNQLARGRALLGSVLDADQSALQQYLAVREAANADLLVTADQLVATRKALAAARTQMVEARRANVSAQINLAILSEGSDIIIHGFVFPVGIPHSFGNSFGAPRMMGTEYQHSHQGTDIMAPMGTPLVACERGIVSKIGSDVLGGNKLWLKGESGTFYYYAHLSSFAAGIANGQVVEAGTIVGYVGDTGNAKGGAPHLHFEIHPDGGPAANPYPLLKVVDQLNREASAQQGTR